MYDMQTLLHPIQVVFEVEMSQRQGVQILFTIFGIKQRWQKIGTLTVWKFRATHLLPLLIFKALLTRGPSGPLFIYEGYHIGHSYNLRTYQCRISDYRLSNHGSI